MWTMELVKIQVPFMKIQSLRAEGQTEKQSRSVGAYGYTSAAFMPSLDQAQERVKQIVSRYESTNQIKSASYYQVNSADQYQPQ